ncbi:MAG: lactonase family protein [Gemmatimonadaceae bacterium]
MTKWIGITTVAALVLAGCSDSKSVVGPDASLDFGNASAGGGGNVYTSTNAVSGNMIVMYNRASDGTLSAGASFATGGTGTGAGLGNQEAVIFAYNARFLITVNAGSNEISVFRRRGNGTLELTDKVGSGGTIPVSIAARDGLIYVLNAGGNGNVTGFTVSPAGKLAALAGSTRPLSQAGGTGPAQLGFTPNGKVLVVTEKATNKIDTYTVGSDGLLAGPTVYASSGATPFGFGFDRLGRLIVSEAQGGAADQGTVSSYDVSTSGALSVLDASKPNFESAPCWIVITRDGRYTYTTNTASNTISGFRIRTNGTLELLDPDGITATSDVGPIDAALSRGDQQYLYVLNQAGTITAYEVESDGGLTQLAGGASGLPAGSNGLVAR